MSELRAFLDGVLVGAFEMSAAGNTTFTYDDGYRSLPTATPFRDLARSFDITSDEATDRYRRITSAVADAFSQAAHGVSESFARELADAVAANAKRRGWTSAVR